MTTKTKATYTAEFKENAVKRANESGNIAQTARELGIKENTLYNWVHKYARPVEMPKVSHSDEHLYNELKRLKKEVARLTEERDILKKAAAYFARETRFRPHGF
jgi:transposase